MGCVGCSFNKTQDNQTNILGAEMLENCSKLSTTDWLSKYEAPNGSIPELLEVRFKNTRKEFFLNPRKIYLNIGDVVVVDAQNGFDVGMVSLKGILAEKQLKKKAGNVTKQQLKDITRKASERDIDKWKEARKREYPVMIRARQLATELNLDMKIGDVEFQGDGVKAIFYYIADERVDFRELIKRYAREFSIKVEMKQIGARQEAAKIGGIGSCGRELCCSTWRTDFTSISAAYAKVQELPINAQKLAGQCGKLKCCLTYELETYLEAKEDFPTQLIEIETDKGIMFPVKIDVLKKTVWYSYNEKQMGSMVPLHVDRIKEIINLNKRGIKIKQLLPEKHQSNDFILEQRELLSPTPPVESSEIKKKKKKKRGGKFNRNGKQQQANLN
jgi:cell fate regulator YaaT (PSP1 superfamily)